MCWKSWQQSWGMGIRGLEKLRKYFAILARLLNPINWDGAIRGAKHFWKANDFIEQEEYEAALRELALLNKYMLKLGSHQELLMCQALWGLGRYREARELAAKVERTVAVGRGTWMTADLAAYLKAYAQEIQGIISAQDNSRMNSGDGQTEPEYSSVDLTKVPDRYKKSYPLRGHPEWVG